MSKMKSNFIVSVVIVLVLNSVSSSLVGDSEKFSSFGDCEYYDAEYAGSCNLTLICTETLQENSFFDPNILSVCPSTSNNFEKFWIGTLDFRDCELPEISNNVIFEVYYNVHTFDVSHLGLTAFHSENFSKAKNLTKLIASHNRIVNISSNLFWEALNLNIVDFSFNEIIHIDSNAFPTENHVHILNLAFNKISELNVQTFQKLNELQQLILTHNQIVDIPPFLFHSSQNLVDLDISWNKIEKIEDFAFFGDVNLDKLNLSHNKITEFHKQIVENHSKLKNLDLSWNNITEIKIDTFKSLQNLNVLDVSGNSIKEINNQTFLTLVKLQHLNLSRTALSEVQPGTFSHQINLRILDLMNNHIKTLDSNILPAELSQLEQLVVENNQLRELSGFTGASFAKIVGVVGSRFECSFLDNGTEIISWYRLGMNSRPMKCIFHNESTYKGNRPNTANRKEDFEVEILNDSRNKENQEFKKELNINVNTSSEFNCNEHKTDLQYQLLLTTWVNTCGLIIIAIALIWLVLRGRFLKNDNFSSISYRKNDIVLLEGAECST